ncbi:MAG: tetratricopeptide repeat protein [Bacteroidaceae bacterium]
MDENLINEMYSEVKRLLKKRGLFEALKEMETFAEGCEGGWLEKVQELSIQYGLLLNFFEQGSNDPKRKDLFISFIQQSYRLNEEIRLARLTQKANSWFFRERKQQIPNKELSCETMVKSLTRFETLRKETTEANQLLSKVEAQQHEDVLGLWFNKLCFSDFWTTEEALEYSSLLTNQNVASEDKGLFIAAVTLNLMHYFDARKMEWLIGALKLGSSIPRARALVGLFIILPIHVDEMKIHSKLQEQLEEMTNEKGMPLLLHATYEQFINTCETSYIQRYIRREIMPEIWQQGRDANWLFKEEDSLTDEPEWMENEKMQKMINDFQSLLGEGEDVFYDSAITLKTNTFFETLHNWFIPFYMEHSMLLSLFEKGKGEFLSQKLVTLCDTDRYSIMLTMKEIITKRNVKPEDMFPGSEDLPELFESEEFARYSEDQKNYFREKLAMRFYLQDLYRFFTLHPHHSELKSPLKTLRDIEKPLCLTEGYEPFKKILMDVDLILNEGCKFFKRKYWKRAGGIYTFVMQQSWPEGKLTQKNLLNFLEMKAFCTQKQGNYALAIEDYKKVLEGEMDLHLSTTWAYKQLAACYRQTKKYDLAMECYLKVDPECQQYATMMNVATCLLELNEWEKASNLFFKASLAKEGAASPLRGIAWTSFLLGKPDRSIEYGERLMTLREAEKEDFLNLGHALVAAQRIPDALAAYRKALTQYSNFGFFKKDFLHDRKFLVQQLPAETVYFLLDCLLKKRV